MSTYVREKVLRIPVKCLELSGMRAEFLCQDDEDDFGCYIESKFPTLFDYGTQGKFQIAPTEEFYIDYVLEHEYDSFGEYSKTRELSKTEKEKYLPVFQQIDPDVNMDYVRLAEYCWYNSYEAPDCYDEAYDNFFDEV